MKPDQRLIDFITQKWLSFPSMRAFHYRAVAAPMASDWMTMDYGALLTHAQNYGQFLTKLGVLAGEKVVLFPENTPDHIIALLGIMFAGAVPCLLDGQLPVEALNEQLKALEPRLAIGSASLSKKYSGKGVLFLSPYAFSDHDLSSAAPSVLLDQQVALILLTSGTSGHYQIVCHSHQGIIAQIERSISVLPAEIFPHSRNLFFLPYFHIYPLVNHLFPLLSRGGECLLLNRINRQALAEGFCRIKPHIIVVVPRILEMIVQGIKEKIKLSSPRKKIFIHTYLKLLKLVYFRCGSIVQWLNMPFRWRFGGALKVIFCGGAALDSDTHQHVEMLLAPVYSGYGLTETAGACVSHTKDKRTEKNRISVGCVLPGCELKIDQPNAQGEGEILIKSNAMMLGYLKDGEIVRPFDAQGWYRTGDLGTIDHKGHLTITDRIKDLIVTSDGKKVSPIMLENQYKHISHISELIIVGLKDTQTDAQKICALVVPSNIFHKEMIEAALFEKASQLPYQYRLQSVFFVKEIIKTNTMKVNRNENIAALLNAMHSLPPAVTLTSLEKKISSEEWHILKRLVQVVGQVLNLSLHEVDVTKNLVQMGMDSIEFADFYLLLLERLEKNKINLTLEKICALPLQVLAKHIYPSDLKFWGCSQQDSSSSHKTHYAAVTHPVDAYPAPSNPMGILHPNFSEHDHEKYLQIPKLDADMVVDIKPRQSINTILLTGAAGFLGAFLLRDLMLHTKANIVCLIRASDDEQAKLKVIENAQKYLVWHDQFLDRLEILSGDLSQPLFGLSQAKYDVLAVRIDSIIHAAAKVNFLASFHALYDDNVNAVKALLRFSMCKKLKRIEYISTFSVLFGDQQGLLDERETHIFPTLSLGYTQSKWSAEQLLYQAKAVGFAVNIYRPGIITGDTVNGLYNKDDLFINMVLSCLQIKKYISLDKPVYIVPVDLVSLSIVKLAAKSSVNNIYHLLGASPLTFSELMKQFSQYIGHLSPTSKEDWLQTIIDAIKEGKESALHRYLPLFIHDPDQRFLNDLIYLSDTKISSEKTDKILLEEGVDTSKFVKELVELYIKVLKS